MTENLKKELVQRIVRNLSDVQILRLVESQPMWGYMIKKQVEARFGLKLRHGALYPLLKAIKKKGFVTSETQRQGGRTRLVYTITGKGKEYLEAYKEILKGQIEGADIR
ncbi:MAG: PadR family transcriptional regulator [Candidatus Bathyarchaeia archaeon]